MPETPAPVVLLLEDDAADAMLIEETLDRLLPQARITRAANRQQYLELLTGGTIDLVLSDGSVPGCQGIDAYWLAREHLPSVPFILITGQVYDDDRRELRGAGISAVLSKDRLDDLGPAAQAALADDDPEVDERRLRIGYQALLVIGRELIQAGDPASIQQLAGTAAIRLTGSDGASLAFTDGDDSVSGQTIRRRRPMVVNDVNTDPRLIGPAGAEVRSGPACSLVVMPVGTAHPVAAITVYWTRTHRPDVTEIRLLQGLADTVALALSTADGRQKLQAAVAERTAELDSLSYAISHDLRAPIRHLSGFTRILVTDATDLTPQTRHIADRIQDAAGQLRDMVDGLLALSRTSRAEVARQPVDLAELARDVALRLAHNAQNTIGPGRAVPAQRSADSAKSMLPVEFVVPDRLPVSGDPRLLTQLLQHLLDNGWKFTAGVPRPRVELGVRQDGAEPVYFVRDNGAGFETGSRDRLFGAFQRLHSADEFPGTGLGLATAQRIIAKHGGTIQATGSPDQGATVSFTLPQ